MLPVELRAGPALNSPVIKTLQPDDKLGLLEQLPDTMDGHVRCRVAYYRKKKDKEPDGVAWTTLMIPAIVFMVAIGIAIKMRKSKDVSVRGALFIIFEVAVALHSMFFIAVTKAALAPFDCTDIGNTWSAGASAPE